MSALDVTVQAQILELLSTLKDQFRLSCLFISHDLHVVRRVSDEVLVMKDGAIVESGTVSDVFERPIHPYTTSLLSV